MKLREQRSFEGPNLWAQQSVVQFLIEDEKAADSAEQRIDRRVSVIVDSLNRPLVREHPLPLLVLTAPEDRLATFQTLVLNLQRLAGLDVNFGCVQATPDPAIQAVVVQCPHAEIGKAAANLAFAIVQRARDGASTANEHVLGIANRFFMIVSSRLFSGFPRAMHEAATQRGIPISRIDPTGRIIELGNGRHRRRYQNQMTSLTSSIAVRIASDKYLTSHFLRGAGIPVPESRRVSNQDQAVTAAQQLGYPVVAKPNDLGAAVGVFLDLRSEVEVRSAFTNAVAVSPSRNVLIERFHTGRDYRVLVVQDRIVAAKERVPAQVTGDGERSIERLIAMANADPRRGDYHQDPLNLIPTDDVLVETLEREGLSLDDIPERGRIIRLRPSTHRQEGAGSVDCTAIVHPHNAAIAIRAARIVGLDVAGIDLIAHDIAQSIWDTSGVVLEVNEAPDIGSYPDPVDGDHIDPTGAIIDMLFPPGAPVRVPIIGVMAGSDGPCMSQIIADVLKESGFCAGMATREGIVIGGMHLRGVDPSGAHGVQVVLNNPTVEYAIFEVEPRVILQSGLPFDYCDVAVLTARTARDLPGLPAAEAVLSRTVGAAGTVVLDSDDPGARFLTAETRGHVTLVTAADLGQRAIAVACAAIRGLFPPDRAGAIIATWQRSTARPEHRD